MSKTVFVPLTDELLYDHPERILGPVIPFSQQIQRTADDPTTFGSMTPNAETEMGFQATAINFKTR